MATGWLVSQTLNRQQQFQSFGTLTTFDMSSTIYQWNHNFPQIARESGFRLKRVETGVLDWRLIGTFDVDRLINENDLDRLESGIVHLSEAPLAKLLNNSVLDPSVSKYFALAQLSVQFLLFCKEFLDKSVTSLRGNLYEMQKDHAKLQRASKRRNAELLEMHGRLNGSSSLTEQQLSRDACKCCKNSVNFGLNELHQGGNRKLASNDNEADNDDGEKRNDVADKNLINTIKLELEIKQLQERLSVAETELKGGRIGQGNGAVIPSTSSVGIQSNLGEEKEQDERQHDGSLERNEELMALIRSQLAVVEEWKTAEKRQMFEEIARLTQKLEQHETETTRDDERSAMVKPKVVLSRKPVEIIEITSADITSGKSDSSELRKIESQWQTKYQELEQSHQQNQLRIEAKLDILGHRYREDRSSSLGFSSAMRNEDSRRGSPNNAKVGMKINENDLLPRTPRGEKRVERRKESNYSLARKQEVKRPAQKGVKHSRSGPVIEPITPPFDAVTVSGNERCEIVAENVTKYAVDYATDEQIEEDENSEEEETRDEKSLADSSDSEQQQPARDFKVEARREFEKRLSAVGIQTDKRGLLKSGMKQALVKMAEQRDQNKRKWHNFFILRNRIVAKVNQLANRDQQRSRNIINKVLDKEIKRPESRDSDAVNLKRGASPLLVTAFKPDRGKDYHEDDEEFGEIGPAEEVKREIISAEINTNTPVLKMLYDLEENGSEEEDEEDSTDNKVPVVPPQPLPRKKVIFNLNEPNADSSNAIPTLDSRKSTQIESSDWSLSSFEEIKDVARFKSDNN